MSKLKEVIEAAKQNEAVDEDALVDLIAASSYEAVIDGIKGFAQNLDDSAEKKNLVYHLNAAALAASKM